MGRDRDTDVVSLPEEVMPGLAAAGWTDEVRLAMAWNGGVSLAVWMGGAAVELDAARRARPAQTLEESQQRPAATSRSSRTSADGRTTPPRLVERSPRSLG